MGFFGSKSSKPNVAAESPGAQHVDGPPPDLGEGGDAENPPIVADAWVVDASVAAASSPPNSYAASAPPRMAAPPPPRRFLPNVGRNSAPPGAGNQKVGAVAVPGPPIDAKKSKIPVAIPEADAKRASLLNPGGPSFGRHPAMLDCCPNCQQQSRTKVRTYPNVLTWAAVVLIFLLFWPLCWIPLVVEKCKASDHTCVKCNAKVGGVKPFEDICEKRRY